MFGISRGVEGPPEVGVPGPVPKSTTGASSEIEDIAKERLNDEPPELDLLCMRAESPPPLLGVPAAPGTEGRLLPPFPGERLPANSGLLFELTSWLMPLAVGAAA